MKKLRAQVIRYAKKLNITNLSTLRSGNVSVRAKEKNIDGFYITPSGSKYSSLKPKDVIFVFLKVDSIKKPSSEWRFHQDIYVNKKRCKCDCSCTFYVCNSNFHSSKNNTCLSLHGWSSGRRRYKMR